MDGLVEVGVAETSPELLLLAVVLRDDLKGVGLGIEQDDGLLLLAF